MKTFKIENGTTEEHLLRALTTEQIRKVYDYTENKVLRDGCRTIGIEYIPIAIGFYPSDDDHNPHAGMVIS